MIGFSFVSGGGTKPRVAPFGGARAMFGTNPLAVAVPVKDHPPIVLDFSTAVVASGKIRVLRDQGDPLPEGWILDKEGRPSRDPADYYDGGVLLPAAGHKGYALSLLVEILGGLLTGAGSLILPDSGYKVGNGVFLMAVNVEAFHDPEAFTELVKQLAATVQATPPLNPGEEVLLPGDPEQRMKRKRLEEGIRVADATWNKITAAAAAVGAEIQG
jgi:LDH2 family malate/lactate/ureidoglycolate dehydrogenase